MKHLLLFIFTAFTSCLSAQNPPERGIPPYRLLTKDSTYITPAKLKKNRPVMIVYFSPDCTHCQHFTDELKSKMDKEAKSASKPFTNTQIVMVTYTAVLNMKLFYINYELAKYPNIIMGTEGTTYVVLRYYNVKTTPYIAVYDGMGKLVQGFEHMPTVDVVEATLKKAS